MSLAFKAKPVKLPERIEREVGRGSVKYIELFGSLAAGSLGAGISANIIDYKVPDGHCAELFALGVQPDYSPGPPEASNLKDVEIGFDDKLTGIKFLCNHLGKNSLPYGDASSIQPIRLLDYPMRPGNLTIKYNEGQRIQIVATGKGKLVSAAYCRAKVLLYEEKDVNMIYRASISNFASLPGGVMQSLPEMIFADYVEDYTTGGKAQWEDAYAREVKDFEEIKITHIGVVPDPNVSNLKIYDHRLKWEAPEYEPYFTITAGRNALPFGDDAEYQPTQRLPSVIADHVFTRTTLKIQVRDTAASGKVSIQLLGTYRKVR